MNTASELAANEPMWVKIEDILSCQQATIEDLWKLEARLFGVSGIDPAGVSNWPTPVPNFDTLLTKIRKNQNKINCFVTSFLARM